MAIQSSKRGIQVGAEVSFYQNKEVRSGTISFVGQQTIAVVPSAVDVLGADGTPMSDVECSVTKGDIL